MKTALKRIIAALAVFGAISALCYSCTPVKVSAASADNVDVETVLEWLDDFNNYTLEEFAEDLSAFAPSQFFAEWIGVYCAYTYIAETDSIKPDQLRAYFYTNENDEICVATCFQYSHGAHITQAPHTTRPVVGSDGKYIEVVPTLTPSQPSSYFTSSSGFYIGASGQDATNLGYTITNERGDTRTVSGSWAWTPYPYYNGSDNFVNHFPIVSASGGSEVSPLGMYKSFGGKTWSYANIPASLIPSPGETLDELNEAVMNYYQTTYNFTPPSQPERKQVETLPQDEFSGLPAGWNEVNPVPLPDIQTPSAPLTDAEIDNAHDWLTDFSFWASVQSGLAFWFAAAAHAAEINETVTELLLGMSLLAVLGYVIWRWGI